MQKNYLAIAFILFLLGFSYKAIAQNVEIFVDDAYVTFSFKGPDGQAKGMYIDVLKTAFSRMKEFNVKILPIPWKRGKYLMENGKGFGLAPAFFHGHDWSYLYPYSLPFYTETIIAVCNENILKQKRPDWPKDYIGLRIGNVAGFDGWGGKEFRTLVEQKKIAYEEVKGSSLNILKLGMKRCDCIMTEEKAFEFELRSLKARGQYDEGGKHVKLKKGAIIGKDPVYIGYSEPGIKSGKYPYANSFQKAFDIEIYKMLKSGEVSQIMRNYKK